MLPQAHASKTKPPPQRHPPSEVPADPTAGLLHAAGDVSDEHVLVVGGNALDLMCALFRGGVAEAILLRPGVRPDHETTDLVIVTEVKSLDYAAAAVMHARRALTKSGRIVLRVSATPERCPVREVARMLRTDGFASVRIRQFSDHAILTGEIPWLRSVPRAQAAHPHQAEHSNA
jgi:hypothetical protein